MLQNARATAFTFSELLRENQQGVRLSPAPFSTQIRVNEMVQFKHITQILHIDIRKWYIKISYHMKNDNV